MKKTVKYFQKSYPLLVVCVFGTISILLSCSESLPTYVEPEIQFEFSFRVDGSPNIPYLTTPTTGVIFRFGFRHFFDDVISSGFFRDGSIDIWLPDSIEITRHIDFNEDLPANDFFMIPEIWYYYFFYWDQKFDDGSILYEHLDMPPTNASPALLRVKATGEIQILKQYNKFNGEEIEFIVNYFIPG